MYTHPTDRETAWLRVQGYTAVKKSSGLMPARLRHSQQHRFISKARFLFGQTMHHNLTKFLVHFEEQPQRWMPLTALVVTPSKGCPNKICTEAGPANWQEHLARRTRHNK
ncbi:hypothetical protein AVEN_40571-1 [Araneus ventricosus]|uniref:Uncharacterized protein n=1 Tax=Araneus ventricosus TaxID=182803 RepID=A0A4Y2LBE0_ARAVE|nr:hypothetical protein AVEN_40571-1 [Araneus ventricosus]